ncbi:uncharacterized protein LOC129288722 [Prosopis cineraria]|uniref:uncharacterized protein LOC129288722 n=1 Tax=Prosopis cineraria TaxID=364024 RepID=UPI00240F9853|nr:uncharacterized protein LOC129288722 [Prosopis cineraria]
MQRNEMNEKSERKPLRNVTNKHGWRSLKSENVKMVCQKQKEETAKEEKEDNDVLDRILLVQSDISSILHQIDELVAQAFRLKTTSREGRKEIESFSYVLSDMLSSLKPWAARFQRALSPTSGESEYQPQQVLAKKPVSNEVRDESKVSDSPEETKLNSLVSPSPLVSWRANCTIERGRQMFMLTPLPISKALSCKRPEPTKLGFNRLSSSTNAFGTSTLLALSGDMPDCSFDAVVAKPTPLKPPASVAIQEAIAQENGFVSSPLFRKRESSMLVMTPCLKMSPPKSCVLLEPISEICHPGKDKDKVRKSTPFPVGIHYSNSETSDSSGGDASQGLALKYLELLGIQQISKSGAGKKTIEASPDWFMSPPKTCVLLEPTDEKPFDLEKSDKGLQITDAVTINQETNKLKDNVFDEHNQTKKSCNEEHFGGKESTMWLEPESSFRTGKCPGENTLKKELWTKFEAASTIGLQRKTSAVSNTTKKGFLDLLEEASCDD